MVSIASTASCFLYISARDEFVTTTFPCPPQIRQICLPPNKPENLKFKRQKLQDIKEKMHLEGVKKQDSFCNKPFA